MDQSSEQTWVGAASVFRDNSGDETLPPRRKSRTVSLLTLLAVAAVTVSYLGAYAAAGALASAGVIPSWTPAEDPRPLWMLGSFVGLMTVFASLAGVARLASRRHLRQIDAMDAEVVEEEGERVNG